MAEPIAAREPVEHLERQSLEVAIEWTGSDSFAQLISNVRQPLRSLVFMERRVNARKHASSGEHPERLTLQRGEKVGTADVVHHEPRPSLDRNGLVDARYEMAVLSKQATHGRLSLGACAVDLRSHQLQDPSIIESVHLSLATFGEEHATPGRHHVCSSSPRSV